MKPRICMCCGEPMAEGANALSRNPNVCASCSSLADGLEESSLPVEDNLGSGTVAKAAATPAPSSPVIAGLPERSHALVGELH